MDELQALRNAEENQLNTISGSFISDVYLLGIKAVTKIL